MPSVFCILKFLLIQGHSHRFIAVVIQFLIPFDGISFGARAIQVLNNLVGGQGGGSPGE